MKSNKEIRLAALTFLRLLDQQKVAQIEGTFLPTDANYLYQNQQRSLAYCLGMSAVCLFIFIYTLLMETNYYAQMDAVGIASLVFWATLVGVTVLLLRQYFKHSQHLKEVLKNPRQSKYGIVITDEYYFERLPDHYHIIPKSNVVRIDYEEERKGRGIYLELLLELDDSYEVRGLLYHPDEYDIKAWLATQSTIGAPAAKQ
jgi:hypothetical protein